MRKFSACETFWVYSIGPEETFSLKTYKFALEDLVSFISYTFMQMHLLTTFSHRFEDQLFLFCSVPRKVPEQLPWATCAAGLEPLVCSRAQLSLYQLQHRHWQQHRQWHQPQAKREKDVSRGKQAQLLYDGSPERDEESFGYAAEEGRTQAVVYGRVVAGAARHRRPGTKASLRVRERNCPKVRVSFMFFFFGNEPSWISCITLLRRTLLPWSIVYCHFPIEQWALVM